jgi:hypothetical protein
MEDIRHRHAATKGGGRHSSTCGPWKSLNSCVLKAPANAPSEILQGHLDVWTMNVQVDSFSQVGTGKSHWANGCILLPCFKTNRRLEAAGTVCLGEVRRHKLYKVIAKYFGASDWTTKEWKFLCTSGNISDPDLASDDEGKPRFRTKPSRRMTKWSTGLGQRQVKAGISMLQDQEEALEFKSLDLQECIAYLGPSS